MHTASSSQAHLSSKHTQVHTHTRRGTHAWAHTHTVHTSTQLVYENTHGHTPNAETHRHGHAHTHTWQSSPSCTCHRSSPALRRPLAPPGPHCCLQAGLKSSPGTAADPQSPWCSAPHTPSTPWRQLCWQSPAPRGGGGRRQGECDTGDARANDLCVMTHD